jgi:hypothetical protein
MSETNEGVEAVVRRLRGEVEEVLAKLPDARLRSRVLAGVAVLYSDKLLESFPHVRFASDAEGEELKAEVQALRRRAVDVARELDEDVTLGRDVSRLNLN